MGKAKSTSIMIRVMSVGKVEYLHSSYPFLIWKAHLPAKASSSALGLVYKVYILPQSLSTITNKQEAAEKEEKNEKREVKKRILYWDKSVRRNKKNYPNPFSLLHSFSRIKIHVTSRHFFLKPFLPTKILGTNMDSATPTLYYEVRVNIIYWGHSL